MERLMTPFEEFKEFENNNNDKAGVFTTNN